MSLVRKISKTRDGAVSTAWFAIDSADAREVGKAAPSPLTSNAAAANLWPREKVHNCEISPCEPRRVRDASCTSPRKRQQTMTLGFGAARSFRLSTLRCNLERCYAALPCNRRANGAACKSAPNYREKRGAGCSSRLFADCAGCLELGCRLDVASARLIGISPRPCGRRAQRSRHQTDATQLTRRRAVAAAG
jgi:hypothetical protein